nr:PKD domain-containing protein [uncultured Methanoregula sp.]
MYPDSPAGRSDSAVSEIIGAIMLISIVVIAVAVIGVAITSQPTTQKIPAVSAVISSTGNTIHIYHGGGDSLEKGQFEIHLDGSSTNSNSLFSNDGNPSWTRWGIGQSLDYTVPSGQPIPGIVQIVYTGTGSSTMLASANFNTGTLTYGPTSTATGNTTTTTTGTTTTTTPVPRLVANFTASPRSGYAPLTVQFTDTSTGPVAIWNWTFGDGNFSSAQSPAYIYPSAGNYSVSLIVKNGTDSSTLTKTDYIWVSKVPFVNYVIEKDVFVYGDQLSFSGATVSGPDATVILTKPLTTSDLNGGTSIAVHTLYVNGDVTLDGGSAGLGSPSNPGNIYVNGNMNLLSGGRDIYGNVYVAGDFNLKDARIHGNVYVNGDVTLGYTPTLDADSHIYYTGTLTYPQYYNHPEITSKCVQQATVPGFTMPDQALPSTKSADFYAARGYVTSGLLASNLKIFADSYSSTSWMPSATNVVIIARNGDITLTGLGGSSVSGVLFAPNGRVTFEGGSFTGVVIARDGFDCISGGTLVTFTNLEDYFSSSADYPF